MLPAIHHLSDDRDRALAVCEDLLRVMQKLRFGIFARQAERLRIALSDPIGKGPIVWKVKRAAPHAREYVTEWRDFANFEMLPMAWDSNLRLVGNVVRQRETLDACGQVLHHYRSAIIPAPIDDLPTMLLCDHEGQADGRWRAYSLIAQLDCYGYTERGIKPKVTQ